MWKPRSLGWPITLGVVMIVLLVALLAGWIVSFVRIALAATSGNAALYWTLLRAIHRPTNCPVLLEFLKSPRPGAAVGVFDFERAASLIEKDVDVLVVDSAHGHTSNVLETIRQIKKRWDIDVVAGNVA